MVFIVRILNSRAFLSTILRRNVARMLLKCGLNVAGAGQNYGLSQDFAEFPPYFLALGCPGPTPLQPCEGAKKIKVQKKRISYRKTIRSKCRSLFPKLKTIEKGPLRGSGPSCQLILPESGLLQDPVAKKLSDLHSVQSRTLTQVVAHAPKVESVIDRRILPDPADERRIISDALHRGGTAACFPLVDDHDARTFAKNLSHMQRSLIKRILLFI